MLSKTLKDANIPHVPHGVCLARAASSVALLPRFGRNDLVCSHSGCLSFGPRVPCSSLRAFDTDPYGIPTRTVCRLRTFGDTVRALLMPMA